MADPLDVLAVMAHPDDAEIFCGGALIKSADAGERTGVIDLTAGEAASIGTPKFRAREAGRAAAVLGLATRRCAGLPDTAVYNSPEARSVVVRLIRETRPRVVVTHWTLSRHPDHSAAGHLVRDASFLAGLKNFPASGRPHRPAKVIHALGFLEEPVNPTFVLDITEQMDRKIEALAAYESQFHGKAGIGEVYPAGNRPVLDQIRSAHAVYGSLIRCEFGEPYWTRETTMIDTLGTAPVSTF